MTVRSKLAVLLLPALMLVAAAPVAVADIQFPKPDRSNADARTLAEFTTFYEQIEEALQAEDVNKIMSFYAEDYLHHGITKKQLKFMCLEVFGSFDDLYSVHIFSKITVHGEDAILVCTGALLGIDKEGKDYQAVDRWVNQNHWLTRIDGQWRMIGGATHQKPQLRGSRLDLHPFF
jgi:ketosteroid isomerase-like protein